MASVLCVGDGATPRLPPGQWLQLRRRDWRLRIMSFAPGEGAEEIVFAFRRPPAVAQGSNARATWMARRHQKRTPIRRCDSML